MKLVNAGIKTKEEALKRMLDGEVFYFDNGTLDFKIYFDAKCLENMSAVFKVKTIHNGDVEPLQIYLKNFSEYKMKEKWYENITKPVPCWVDDTDSSVKDCIDLIDEKIKEGNFVSISGVLWEYATPITKDDLLDED